MSHRRAPLRARWFPGIAGLWIGLLASAAPCAAGRVVAVGDVHGAYEGLVAILREAGLVDERLDWAGGDATFVQTGDFTDKGPRVREVMDLLRKLEEQAPARGGRVVVLLGNHEVMNLIGLFRDFDPRAYADFADDGSERRRRQAWQELRDYRRRRARAGGSPPTPDAEAGWRAAHPPGRLELLAALAPDGEYGRWLRARDVAVEIDGNVFMHAGLDPGLDLADLDRVNDRVRDELKSYDRSREYLVLAGVILPFFDRPAVGQAIQAEIEIVLAAARRGQAPRGRAAEERHRDALLALADLSESWLVQEDGPLWFRGFALWPNAEGLALAAALTGRLGVSRFVVGHSVLHPPGLIRSRFDGRVFLIDTGMLESLYHGRASALEIRDGVFTAIYVGERERLLEPEPAAAAVAGH